jgi:ABC-type transport system involved in multi-copper enzyme maturation permease subunit
MRSVSAIAYNTFREAVRNRVLYVILIFALIMIGASGMISRLSITEHGRIIKNLGFASINLFGVAIAVFVGVSLVFHELDRRTIYTIVSKPISRSQFLLGKYFGLLLTVYLNLLIMTLGFLFMLHYRQSVGGDAGFPGVVLGSAGRAVVNLVYWKGAEGSTFAGTVGVMPVVLNTALELGLITAFAVFFSSFTTPTLSMLFTVLTFVAGRLNQDLVLFAENLKRIALEDGTPLPRIYYAVSGAARVIPNLGVFHRSVEEALYRPVPQLAWTAVVYALFYTSAILFIAMVVFDRRNFK